MFCRKILYTFLVLSILCFIKSEGASSWFSFLGFSSPPQALTETSKFKQCDPIPKFGKLLNIAIIPCEGESECILNRGTNSTLELEFISFIPAKSVFLKFGGNFGGFFSAPFAKENICTDDGIECPIVPRQPYKYTNTYFIEPTFPVISLDVTIRVADDRGNDIACAVVPIDVK